MRKMNSLTTSEQFKTYVNSLRISLPFDDEVQTGPSSPFVQSHVVYGRTIGNSFAILPMEGADGTIDGRPTELIKRRWQHFGASGAKLIWLEAAAVRPDARGNPNQLMMLDSTVDDISRTRESMVEVHKERFGRSDDLMVGLQLTHAGRLARPNDKHREPKIVYHHPILDSRFGVAPDAPVMSDDEISQLGEDFIKAAVRAKRAGFDFVDIKHCHGYFGHELLSAVTRPGRYGGSLENRTRFLREVVSGIRAEAPGLGLAVRLSAFDFVPFQRDSKGYGIPVSFEGATYPYAFGGDGSGLGIDLTEPLALLALLKQLDIILFSLSAGAAYSLHLMRPATLPDSDGYYTPEDPLIGVARLISVAAELKRQRPELLYVSTGHSYLQQWLPNVTQAALREGKIDIIGLGRIALSYPDIAADIIMGKPLKRQLLCRCCNDCLSSIRLGLVSGCYSHDDYYKTRYGKELRRLKREIAWLSRRE